MNKIKINTTQEYVEKFSVDLASMVAGAFVYEYRNVLNGLSDEEYSELRALVNEPLATADQQRLFELLSISDSNENAWAEGIEEQFYDYFDAVPEDEPDEMELS